MSDFRLKVFYTVARRLNFTRAAAELFITQPSVTKHIRELESQYKQTFFERSGNKKIKLTPAGEVMMRYAENLLNSYRDLDYEMSLLAEQHKGTLRIGASTTIAQYVIPPVLAQFHQKFRDIKVELITGNTDEIEQALLDKRIETGIIEGISRNQQIKYDEFARDELVLVCGYNNQLLKKDSLKPDELKNYPLLIREYGSGTLEVILHALKTQNIKLHDLQIEMQLGSTESIKAYLLHSNCLAFISIHALLKELKHKECRIIDVKGLTIERPFHFIHLYGQPSGLTQLFMRFAFSLNR